MVGAPAAQAEAITRRRARAGGLDDPEWLERIIETTWKNLPTLCDVHDFPRDEDCQPRYRAMRGPDYMRALRRRLEMLGVTLVDHAPAMELLRHSDGSIGGARGRRRGEDWEVAADRATMSAEACCDLENWHRLTPPGDLAAVFEVEMDI